MNKVDLEILKKHGNNLLIIAFLTTYALIFTFVAAIAWGFTFDRAAWMSGVAAVLMFAALSWFLFNLWRNRG